MRYVIKKNGLYFAGFNGGKPIYSEKPLQMGEETAHEQASTLGDVTVEPWLSDEPNQCK